MWLTVTLTELKANLSVLGRHGEKVLIPVVSNGRKSTRQKQIAMEGIPDAMPVIAPVSPNSIAWFSTHILLVLLCFCGHFLFTSTPPSRRISSVILRASL